MDKLELTKEEAKAIVQWDRQDKYNIVLQEVESTSRWSIHYRIVIQDKETEFFYEDGYSVGATESQDEFPYDYSDPDFTRVYPVEKIVVDYTKEKPSE